MDETPDAVGEAPEEEEVIELNNVDDDKLEGAAAPRSTAALRELPRGMLVDTGSAATVADGDECWPEYELEPSPGSVAGQNFVGAATTKIPNRGQRKVRLRIGSPKGALANMTVQDAKVRRPILSVAETNDSGNLAIFDGEESALLTKGAPEIAQIRALLKKATRKLVMVRENNTFTLPTWVEPPFTRQGK